MIDLLVAGLGYVLVSWIARRRGFRGPVAGIVGALSFPIGLMIGAVAYGILSGEFDTAPSPGDPVFTVAAVTGGLLLTAVTGYYLTAPVGSGTDRKTRFPYRLTGVALVIAGLLLWVSRASVYAIVGGAAAFAMAAQCFSWARRQRLRSAEHFLKEDTRPPVLYLRSFATEGQGRDPISPTVSIRPSWWPESRWEEQMAAIVSRRVGPMIALGNPQDYLPQGGAARTYVGDADWFDVFRSYAGKAAAILILPGVSAGLARELRHIRQHLEATRVFLLNPESTEAEWRRLASLLGDAGFDVAGEPPPPDSVVGFSEHWSLRPVGTELATPAEYAEAAVRALGVDGDRPEFKGSLGRIRRSWAYALGSWMASLFHGAYALVRRR